MSFLLDTNVISELRKTGRANSGVLAWFAEVDPADVYLSVVTIGEVRKGIERVRRRGDFVAAASLDRWFEKLIEAHSARLLPIDREVAEHWGRLNVPDPVPVTDGLIAATAKVHGLTVVTRNLGDIERTGVECFNPFT